MENLLLGRYLPACSVLHRLDPRTKIAASLIIVFSSVYSTWQGILPAALLVGISLALSGIPVRLFWVQVRVLWIILLASFVMQVVLTPGEVVLSLGPLKPSLAGIEAGSQMVIRLVLVILTGMLLTATTSPLTLATGLEYMLQPLGRIGLPVREMTMAISIATRFIPVFLEEARTVAQAQASRGAAFNGPGIKRRVDALISLIVPLFAGAIRRTEDLALAMEARCYQGGSGRSRMNRLAFSGMDVAALGYAGITLVAAVVWRVPG